MGHEAGDEMLRNAAQILRSAASESDFVARIGGDEFVIICFHQGDEQYLSELAGAIQRRMKAPIIFRGHEIRTGVSVGIALHTPGSEDTGSLLVDADIALFEAKRTGRSRVQYYSKELDRIVKHSKRLADELVAALERDEIFAHYQPQFHSGSHELLGVEALCRWRHPLRGLLNPAYFLKVANDLGVIDEIDRVILNNAARDLRFWDGAGLKIPRISVNVSSKRLHDPDLITELRNLDLPWNRFSFELVESIFLDESEDIVRWNIDQLKELGIQIELDDFGTGHTSIIGLKKLQPHKIKIDKELVLPLTGSSSQRLLVGSIIEIAHAVGSEVIAEGVESEAHIQELALLNCNYLQGYALGRPMCARDILDRFGPSESALQEQAVRIRV